MREDSTCGVCNRVYKKEEDFLSGTSRWRVCSSGHLWFNCSCGSTLIVTKGKYSWYTPDIVLSPEARGVFNSVSALKDLPHIPSSVMEIQRLIEDPSMTPKVLASRLKAEPILATQLLKIAENIRKSRNPRNPPIQSLEHAIVYVGYKALSDLVLAASINAFKLPSSQFNLDQYWIESLITGSIAEYLSKKLQLKVPEDQLFLAGTLCNVGKIVTASCFPPLIDKIIRDISSPKTLSSWLAAEKSYNFPDHAILGEIGAALWGFPDFVLNAARKHHDLPTSKGKNLLIHEIVAVANQFMHWLLFQPHRMDERLLKDFALRFNLSEKEMDSLAKEMDFIKTSIEHVQKIGG